MASKAVVCIIFSLIRALTDCTRREGLRKYANSKDKRDIVENNIFTERHLDSGTIRTSIRTVCLKNNVIRTLMLS